MSGTPAFDDDGFTSMPSDRFLVLNDAPLGDDDAEDLLEYTRTARGVADLVVASRGGAPFTLAVDAAWGMGKSSLLHRLERTLTGEPGVSVVWFNAWTAGGTSVLEGLIKSVLLGFDRNVVRRAVRSMSQRAHLLGALRALALLVGSFVGVGHVVDQMWRALALDSRSRNQIKGVLRDAFDAWIKQGGTPDGRRLLVVFVDDLDRCSSDHIVEVCEAIKLYLDVPGVVFVLACDQAALWRAVHESAGIGRPADAVEYLEKIIQIHYRIPPPSPSLAMRLVNGYLERSRTSNLFDRAMKDVIIERSGRNPRRIKRLINSIELEYHLNAEWGRIGLDNLVRVVMLQHFYPDYYRVLIDPRHVDPITDFLRYHEFREAVRQGDLGTGDWQALFTSRQLRLPADDGATGLADLEHELPPCFPELAADRDFVALVRRLGGPRKDDLLRNLTLQPLTTAGYAEAPDDHPWGFPRSLRKPLTDDALYGRRADTDPLTGLRVLWIDDNPDTNGAMTDLLRMRGVTVTLATDRASALRAFELTQPDAVLSDFTRGGNPNAGIEDLEYFRVNRIYAGPVIFASGHDSPIVRRRLAELNADGPTNDENDIVRRLVRLAAPSFAREAERPMNRQ
jgi:CheY-like chemotaxis protein